MILERLRVEPHRPLGDPWPFSVPAIGQPADDGLALGSPVTVLVGENGSGKSTLVEAVAEQFDLDAQDGRSGRKDGNDRPRTVLGEALTPELVRHLLQD